MVSSPSRATNNGALTLAQGEYNLVGPVYPRRQSGPFVISDRHKERQASGLRQGTQHDTEVYSGQATGGEVG